MKRWPMATVAIVLALAAGAVAAHAAKPAASKSRPPAKPPAGSGARTPAEKSAAPVVGAVVPPFSPELEAELRRVLAGARGDLTPEQATALGRQVIADLERSLARPYDPAAVERRYAALSGVPFLVVRCDTLGGGTLLALAGRTLATLRLWRSSGAGFETVPLPPPMAGGDQEVPRSLERVYLVAPFSGGPADSLRHKALLWYALLGTAEPHELWVASLDGGPAGAQLYDAGIGGDTLAVVRARGDVVLRAAHAVWDFSPVVEPRNSPSSYVRVEEIYRFVGDYPHLVQARPVDDATLALVRAAEAQHGLGLWPVADLEVDPALGAWLAANPHVTAASTSREAPEVWRIELLGSRERAAAVVTRVAAGPGIRWQLRLAGPAVPHAR